MSVGRERGSAVLLAASRACRLAARKSVLIGPECMSLVSKVSPHLARGI